VFTPAIGEFQVMASTAKTDTASNRPLLSMLALLLMTVVWGLTFPVIKQTVDKTPPLTFIAARFLLGTLFLAPAAFLRGMPSRTEWRIGFGLGAVLFVGDSAQTLGLTLTSASNAGFITGVSVALVPLFAWLVDGARVKTASILGIGLSLAGLMMLTMGGAFGLNLGDAWVLVCAIAFAVHIVWVGHVTRKLDSTRIACIQVAVCAAFSILSAVLVEFRGPVSPLEGLARPHFLLSVGFCGIIATALAYWVQISAQKHTTAVQTALIFTCEPVFSSLFGYWMNGDRLSATQFGGCSLMLGGMLCADLGEALLRALRTRVPAK